MSLGIHSENSSADLELELPTNTTNQQQSQISDSSNVPTSIVSKPPKRYNAAKNNMNINNSNNNNNNNNNNISNNSHHQLHLAVSSPQLQSSGNNGSTNSNNNYMDYYYSQLHSHQLQHMTPLPHHPQMHHPQFIHQIHPQHQLHPHHHQLMSHHPQLHPHHTHPQVQMIHPIHHGHHHPNEMLRYSPQYPQSSPQLASNPLIAVANAAVNNGNYHMPLYNSTPTNYPTNANSNNSHNNHIHNNSTNNNPNSSPNSMIRTLNANELGIFENNNHNHSHNHNHNNANNNNSSNSGINSTDGSSISFSNNDNMMTSSSNASSFTSNNLSTNTSTSNNSLFAASIANSNNSSVSIHNGNPLNLVTNSSSNPIDQQISNIPSRTVYLGNIPSNITANELLNHVRSGTIENVKILHDKNCAFISFLDENSAMLFHSDAILKRLNINNYEIRIGWGRPTPIQPVVSSCVQRYNATRNVYVGNLLNIDEITEDDLLNDLSEYGTIETIKILKDKKISFIHFTSILSAIRCVQNLPLLEKYKDCKIFYGKDRCAFITKTQQHNAAQYLGLNPNVENLLNEVNRDLIANALVQQSNAAAVIATSAGGSSNLGNRTIYLGNLHPDCTTEEICNVVRGGILQNIRLIKERHVCFITFIDPISAAQFYAMCSLHGLIIHNRKIKIGWGKHSGALPNSINLAVGNGASRNIYIGLNESEFNNKLFTKKKLYDDFKEFGDIEQINFFDEKLCCFVNFCNISNAIKAIDGIRNNVDYANCKVNFGKDRCGNIPRQFQVNYQGPNSSNNSNHLLGDNAGDYDEDSDIDIDVENEEIVVVDTAAIQGMTEDPTEETQEKEVQEDEKEEEKEEEEEEEEASETTNTTANEEFKELESNLERLDLQK